jgi:hypothetical protein
LDVIAVELALGPGSGDTGRVSRTSLALAFAVVAVVAGCHDKPRWHTSDVRLTRLDPVRRDATGKALTFDAQFSYDNCPGTQIEVIRGGADFAACMAKYKVGQMVPAKIYWYFHPNGHYQWEVHELGGCARPPDPNDEASYDMVRECSDLKVNGVAVGFRCNEIPEKHLLERCPWFQRE